MSSANIQASHNMYLRVAVWLRVVSEQSKTRKPPVTQSNWSQAWALHQAQSPISSILYARGRKVCSCPSAGAQRDQDTSKTSRSQRSIAPLFNFGLNQRRPPYLRRMPRTRRGARSLLLSLLWLTTSVSVVSIGISSFLNTIVWHCLWALLITKVCV